MFSSGTYVAFFFFFFNYFYLAALGLSCSMWDLVPWPGNEPGPPALGAQRLSHRTTREIPLMLLLFCTFHFSIWSLV